MGPTRYNASRQWYWLAYAVTAKWPPAYALHLGIERFSKRPASRSSTTPVSTRILPRSTCCRCTVDDSSPHREMSREPGPAEAPRVIPTTPDTTSTSSPSQGLGYRTLPSDWTRRDQNAVDIRSVRFGCMKAIYQDIHRLLDNVVHTSLPCCHCFCRAIGSTHRRLAGTNRQVQQSERHPQCPKGTRFPCNDILQYPFARPGNHPNHEDSQSTEKKVSVSGKKKKSFLEI